MFLSRRSWSALYWYRRLRVKMGRRITPTMRGRLTTYHNRHAGETCVIMGNGPSLRHMDFSAFAECVTFGTNRIYLLFDELPFRPTYYVAANKYMLAQFADEVLALEMPRFIPFYASPYLDADPNLLYMDALPETGFATDIGQGVWTGVTVTYMALQLAYYMGFARVVLVGVDHRYRTQGTPHQLVRAQADDTNHFHRDYFGRGTYWQLPDLAGSEANYRVAKAVFERDGRKILDATVNGALDVFPKVDYRMIACAEE
ncbi:MAG: hypothetical protein AAFV33_27840 [Chloroflexota bacterium]